MKLPRIMIAAPASGSGKTMVTCGILQALMNRGLKTSAFKCGPDYIDPMFHSKVIGAKSKNLDTYFTEDAVTRYLFARSAREADISVIEGVMGFYDGIVPTATTGSSYELSKVTDTPVILVVDCRSASLSILPVIQGFLSFRKDSHIKGVILNRTSENQYRELKKEIEATLPVKVLGYIPYAKDLVIESRHLGLLLPEEIKDYHHRLNQLAELFEKTLEIDEILRLAGKVKKLSYQAPNIPKVEGKPKIAVAKDQAFCFYYEDNLQLLTDMGAELVTFSPLKDKQLPEGIQGMILGGGYPELFAEELSNNHSMRESIKAALLKGLPCVAECGGFMYLHETMEDMNGRKYPMVGSINGEAYKTNKLNRFGYIELSANFDQMLLKEGETIRGHEYHYFESTNLGESMKAKKPFQNTEWNCMHGTKQWVLGFPHLYYYSNPEVPYRFLCNRI